MSILEATLLPEAVKEGLCRELLEEFGARSIRHRPGKSELTHGCLVTPEAHSNQDKDPTASLNYDKLTYNCFGCHARGGILWLICTLRGCTRDQARAWLGGETGTEGNLMSLKQLLDYQDALYSGPKARRTPIPRYAPSVLDPWLTGVHPWLTEGAPDLGIEGRGIPEGNVRDLKIGWDPADDTIVIPHFWKGELTGWQKRRLSGTGPKYLSTEDLPKDRTLYDYDRRRRTAVIVESPMSVARHRHAIPMEATFGSQVSDRQVELIAAHYERCILWMDNDEAGWRALEGGHGAPGLIDRLSSRCPVWVVASPIAGDPADLTTEAAQMILEDFVVPGGIWAKPDYLMCPRCLGSDHAGACKADTTTTQDERDDDAP